MIEIILLIFLTRQIGQMAIRRGLKPGGWKFKTVAFWILFEMMGVFTGVIMFGITKENILGVMAFSIACAFGGYLIVRKQLERIPEQESL
jgi:hypothetical protein